jgi:hypothetical protein
MINNLPETYIQNVALAEAMAYAELNQFEAAKIAEVNGFVQNALNLLTGVNNVGVIAANSYLADMETSARDEGQELDLEQMRTQVQAGRFIESSQIKRKKEELRNREFVN